MRIYFNLILVLLTFICKGQCDIQLNERSDGAIIRYFNPVLIGDCSNCDIGCGISTNGESFFLNVVVRYFGELKRISGSLMIHLLNGKSIILEKYTDEKATLKGNQISLGIFYLTSEDCKVLLNSKIKTIIFKEQNDKNQIVLLKSNNDFAINQLKCLL